MCLNYSCYIMWLEMFEVGLETTNVWAHDGLSWWMFWAARLTPLWVRVVVHGFWGPVFFSWRGDPDQLVDKWCPLCVIAFLFEFYELRHCYAKDTLIVFCLLLFLGFFLWSKRLVSVVAFETTKINYDGGRISNWLVRTVTKLINKRQMEAWIKTLST